MGLFDVFKKKRAATERPPLPPRPQWRPGMVQKPDPQAENNLVIVILDSCRYDAFMAAAPKVISKVSGGRVEKRYSYAAWTAPSHYNLLTGLLPHTSPQNVYASEYYKEDFHNYNSRLGSKGTDIDFGAMVPGLWLPAFMQSKLGYDTHARMSLPVLNPKTGINRGFDSFELMEHHNDMAAMLPTMKFDGARPQFYLLNVGETHYPYAKPQEDSSMWPRISGVNGVFKKMNDQIAAKDDPEARFKEDFQFFDQDKLDQLRERQIDTVRYLDGVFEQLYDMLPKNTHVIVTADHGELFGEAGFFGHGPIMHEKCFEVPYLEGKLR
jgi:arylsulfatase A-like enzyme